MTDQLLLVGGEDNQVIEGLKAGESAILSGRLGKGIEIYQSVLEIEPGNQIARKRIRELGRKPLVVPGRSTKKHLAPVEEMESLMVLADSGQCLAAKQGLEKLISKYPGDATLHFVMGNVERSLGRSEESIVHYIDSINLNPRYSDAYLNLGSSYEDLGRVTQAIQHYEKAIEHDRRNFLAFHHLASIHYSLGDADQAIEGYLRALRVNPMHVSSNTRLGSIFRDLGQPERAMKLYQLALDAEPECVDALNGLGTTLRLRGSKAQAVEQFKRAVEHRPNDAYAHYNLSDMLDYGTESEHLNQMKKLVRQPGLSNEDRALLGFALFNVFDQLKERVQAFECLREANRVCRGSINYDQEHDRRLISKLKDYFVTKPEAFDHEGAMNIEGKSPIFVVGMPRSGTSLSEQILSSHSAVYGAGGQICFKDTISGLLEAIDLGDNPELSGEKLSAIRAHYLRNLDRVRSDLTVVVDKMPTNFLYVGFILSAIPEARIVHCKRDSVATCFSIFSQYFGHCDYGYGYDLTELGRYYRLYEELMAFWCRRYPEQIYTLNYESLTEDQENQTRLLLEHCQLAWEPSCLDFHLTERFVDTSSSLQIKQPLYQGGSDVWKKYRRELEPLTEALFWEKVR